MTEREVIGPLSAPCPLYDAGHPRTMKRVQGKSLRSTGTSTIEKARPTKAPLFPMGMAPLNRPT
jgi:hypothetical protein